MSFILIIIIIIYTIVFQAKNYANNRDIDNAEKSLRSSRILIGLGVAGGVIFIVIAIVLRVIANNDDAGSNN